MVAHALASGNKLQTTVAMHENIARQLRDFLEEPVALEWGGFGDGLPTLAMDPLRFRLSDAVAADGGGAS